MDTDKGKIILCAHQSKWKAAISTTNRTSVSNLFLFFSIDIKYHMRVPGIFLTSTQNLQLKNQDKRLSELSAKAQVGYHRVHLTALGIRHLYIRHLYRNN